MANSSVDSSVIDVEYEQPACTTRHAWVRVPIEPSQSERALLKEKIARLLKEKNAVMVSHYYVHPDLQDLAEATGCKHCRTRNCTTHSIPSSCTDHVQSHSANSSSRIF